MLQVQAFDVGIKGGRFCLTNIGHNISYKILAYS